MPTNSPADSLVDLDRLRHLDAQAVLHSVSLVRGATSDDLGRPTPCSAWTLADLLAHMTAQHHGFAAAALGHGEDLAHWQVLPPAEDAATEYAEAAELAITAFASVTAPDQVFTLPELPAVQTFPAARAIGFHFIDHVVHGWDVARSLGLAYDPDPDLLAAALPIAHAVPDGDLRLAPDSPFRPALPAQDGASTLERILTALGRSPGWRAPTGDTAAGSDQVSAVVRSTTC